MSENRIGDADWATARDLRRDNGSATKTALLRGARAVFAARGFAGATIGEIATAAGVSRPSFYVYFETKDEVFRGVAEQLFAAVLEAHHHTGPTADDPVLLSRASVEAFIDVYVENLELVEEVDKRAEHDPRVKEIFTEIVGRPARRTRRHIQRLLEAGLAQPQVDPDYAASVMRAVLLDAAREIRLQPDSRQHFIAQATRLYLAVIGYRGQVTEAQLAPVAHEIRADASTSGAAHTA